MSAIHLGIIAPEFPPQTGGMQVVAINLARQLHARHRVTVCTRLGSGRADCPFEVMPILRGPTKDTAAALNALPVDVWLAMNAGYVAIAEYLDKPVVGYFHGNDFLSPWIFPRPLPLRALARIPFLRKPATRLIDRVGRARIQRGLRHTAKILTNSRNTEALIRMFFQFPGEISVCHPGVEDKFFQCREASHGMDGTLTLISVCRLQQSTRRKNVAGVLRALPLLKSEVRLKYVICGDGDDRTALEHLALELGLGDIVEFVGQVGDDDLLRLYRHADLFVLPVKASETDVEGFGIVYLEAAAFGLPVLCSAAGGALDAVRDGETGIVLKSSEPGDIARGIRAFLRMRASFRPDRLKRFASGFTWDRAAARIEGELLRCLPRPQVQANAIPER
jgi:phosphatidylinositol alpha-1,6-mannosyltransferase